ncbi:maleate cis-trans isomerase family protein [Oceaniglobus roseus]|uniref:maleate cis-trans isomerase family protein n=1 Tax=Oceaniglobus roseus TaxID=1737570 RepID=UPI000C7F3962|nr:Asp/Glu racemase [Kandeliimicrobium roseum]
MAYPYDLIGPHGDRTLGLIVLKSDETIEPDFRRLFPSPKTALYVSRVESAPEVTRDTLAMMEDDLPAAAGLMPESVQFHAVGYGCTSGTSVIGAARIAELVSAGCRTEAVTEPVSGLVAACRAKGITRLAFLSPYIEPVSRRLRTVLSDQGIATPVFGSFDEAREAAVARISPDAVRNAAQDLAGQGEVDGIFMSCTNLRTLDVIPGLKEELGMPVLSSNLVLAWHMAQLTGAETAAAI